MKIIDKIDAFLSEQNEYQKFFAEMLKKEGKSIPSMSDSEKKTFFNKVSTEWAKKKKG
uniref:Uncharacterized protein n=1 Tax=viral metagenome TaxID=1070528 RepID=A0A6M3JPF2_9ZZZZ